MRILLDTNILIRYSHMVDPEHDLVERAISELQSRGWELCVCNQSLYEFWAVATRPEYANGLNLEPARAAREVGILLQTFSALSDPARLRDTWLQLCTGRAVCGKAAHDARLVALVLEHGITHLLTLNTADFKRYPEITCIHPADV